MKFSPKQREALKLVADGRFIPRLAREEDGWHARWQALGAEDEVLNGWVDEYVRTFAMTRLSEDAEDQKHETLHDAWMLALRSQTGLVIWDEAECVAFAAELERWSGNAKEDRESRSAIVFSFKASGGLGGRPVFEVSCAVPKGRKMLKALGQAAYVWPQLVGLKRNGTRLGVKIGRIEAEEFLRRGARDLREAGYGVEGVELKVGITAGAEVAAGAAGSGTGDLSRETSFKLTVRVAGEPVTADEIRFLLDQESSLVYFRERWIEVDRSILKEALRALERGVDKKANVLSFVLGLGHIGSLEIEEAKAHGWLRGLVSELRHSANRRSSSVRPEQLPGFEGTLRDYQRRGVEWLRFLTDHGFGALLADDMGLGKTVQVIAWMLSASRPKTLVVAPLTLLSNWKHELARFAPSLRVYVHQGGGRHVSSGFKAAVATADVTITSYNLLVRDYDELCEIKWDALVADEAQAVKNPETQAARALRALTPSKRIAMTGTPIENSVADIWSLEAFLNPGLLGDRRSFHERFVRPIALDGKSAAGRRLRHALEPFVLRRLKSDGEIAAELGEKREIREYCELTDAERRDYETALAEFRATERAPGDVFALITRLKLICDGAGKLERLCDLLETIFENGESALVFSQYAKVGDWLRTQLAKRFGRRFPFLHGALSPQEREAEVTRFNRSGPSAFILSLRAGGFGLNLTKATHVIHFDRWWNPAVENQATDRAHRIGQTKDVFAHLFVTAGTLEEHVDEILRRKLLVADAVITEAEWLEAAKLDE